MISAEVALYVPHAPAILGSGEQRALKVTFQGRDHEPLGDFWAWRGFYWDIGWERNPKKWEEQIFRDDLFALQHRHSHVDGTYGAQFRPDSRLWGLLGHWADLIKCASSSLTLFPLDQVQLDLVDQRLSSRARDGQILGMSEVRQYIQDHGIKLP